MRAGTILPSPRCSERWLRKAVHWKDLWESYSAEEKARMESTPVEELLEDIRNGHYGQYFNIWRVVGRRSSLEEAGWTLFSVLVSDADYLYRYHCAAALLELTGIDGLQPVDLSGNHDGVEDNIGLMKNALEDRLGPMPNRSGDPVVGGPEP